MHNDSIKYEMDFADLHLIYFRRKNFQSFQRSKACMHCNHKNFTYASICIFYISSFLSRHRKRNRSSVMTYMIFLCTLVGDDSKSMQMQYLHNMQYIQCYFFPLHFIYHIFVTDRTSQYGIFHKRLFSH